MRQRIFYIITDTEAEFKRLERILNADPEIKVACQRLQLNTPIAYNTNRVYVMPQGMKSWGQVDKIEFTKKCKRRQISIYNLTESKLQLAAREAEKVISGQPL